MLHLIAVVLGGIAVRVIERAGAFGGSLTAFSQDRQQRGPAGGVEQRKGVGHGVRARDCADEGEFVLVWLAGLRAT